MSRVPRLPLSPNQRQIRFWGILAITGFIAYAWVLNPEKQPLGRWGLSAFPRMTGLPCPLCGGTRATHYLLQGNLDKALYYNWLALPSLALALALVAFMSFELYHGRVFLPKVHFSPRRLFLGVLLFMAIWIAQVYSALYSPKPELLNTEGLYFKLKPENTSPSPAEQTRVEKHTLR